MIPEHVRRLYYRFPKVNEIQKYFESGHSWITILEMMAKNPEVFFRLPSDKTIMNELKRMKSKEDIIQATENFEMTKTFILDEFKDSLNKFLKTIKTSLICDGQGYYLYPNIKKLVKDDEIIFKYILYPDYDMRTLFPFLSSISIIEDKKFRYHQYENNILDQYYGKSGEIITAKHKHSFVLPVTRYASKHGIGAQVIKLSDKTSICGTYYYFEKDSNVYLSFDRAMIFPNKFKAMYDLSNKSSREIILEMFQNPNIEMFLDGEIPSPSFQIPFDMKEFKKVTCDIYKEKINKVHRLLSDGEDVVKFLKNKTMKNYKYLFAYQFYKTIEKMFISSDFDWYEKILPVSFLFDEKICDILKNKVDVVIFTTAYQSSKDIRTEIMDLRSRDKSYGSLFISNDKLIMIRREEERKHMINFEDVECDMIIDITL